LANEPVSLRSEGKIMLNAENLLNRIRLGEDSKLELKRLVMRGDTKVEAPHAV
jgi:hypothetical protein